MPKQGEAAVKANVAELQQLQDQAAALRTKASKLQAVPSASQHESLMRKVEVKAMKDAPAAVKQDAAALMCKNQEAGSALTQLRQDMCQLYSELAEAFPLTSSPAAMAAGDAAETSTAVTTTSADIADAALEICQLLSQVKALAGRHAVQTEQLQSQAAQHDQQLEEQRQAAGADKEAALLSQAALHHQQLEEQRLKHANEAAALQNWAAELRAQLNAWEQTAQAHEAKEAALHSQEAEFHERRKAQTHLAGKLKDTDAALQYFAVWMHLQQLSEQRQAAQLHEQLAKEGRAARDHAGKIAALQSEAAEFHRTLEAERHAHAEEAAALKSQVAQLCEQLVRESHAASTHKGEKAALQSQVAELLNLSDEQGQTVCAHASKAAGLEVCLNAAQLEHSRLQTQFEQAHRQHHSQLVAREQGLHHLTNLVAMLNTGLSDLQHQKVAASGDVQASLQDLQACKQHCAQLQERESTTMAGAPNDTVRQVAALQQQLRIQTLLGTAHMRAFDAMSKHLLFQGVQGQLRGPGLHGRHMPSFQEMQHGASLLEALLAKQISDVKTAVAADAADAPCADKHGAAPAAMVVPYPSSKCTSWKQQQAEQAYTPAQDSWDDRGSSDAGECAQAQQQDSWHEYEHEQQQLQQQKQVAEHADIEGQAALTLLDLHKQSAAEQGKLGRAGFEDKMLYVPDGEDDLDFSRDDAEVVFTSTQKNPALQATLAKLFLAVHERHIQGQGWIKAAEQHLKVQKDQQGNAAAMVPGSTPPFCCNLGMLDASAADSPFVQIFNSLQQTTL
ncbi:hypothetical protein DUNSADRAFT_4515 [Dunaliella salina]|uniref:Uncharacterized protein n=1 Tax=Dunaliella salina TaxID=3046 RepID=A0ABQ7GRW7_DUNSA|nr:hypothetical protein DUNSADRAFT_4515 [Dunaliella salina]|eukprot:KAF5837356.1 hypothetical protein DUNSADRAFT_4515 [Dunaliella salina]